MKNEALSLLVLLGCVVLQVHSQYVRVRCSYWVRRGLCRTNGQYMRTYCPGRCAPKAPARTQQIGTQQARNCAHWASIGECTKNPAYMLQHCASNCKQKPRSPGMTKQERQCRDWARTGECTKNAGYMLVHCAKSCKEIGITKVCRDKRGDCAYLRRRCRDLAVQMSCPHTCGRCGSKKHASDDRSGTCADRSTSCPGWARRGQCDINPRYMLRNCQESCACCRDNNALCTDWIRRFGCRNRGVFHNCRKSCRTCLAFTGEKIPNKKATKRPGQGIITTKPTTTTPIPEIVTTKPSKTRPPEHAHTNADICGSRFAIQLMVGGRRANVAEWPWMAAIALADYPTKVFCGGSIIADQYILTAAHCFIDHSNPKDLIVRIAELNLKEKDVGEHVMGVASIVVHPDFSIKTLDNDVAIIKLNGRLNYSSTARPICLPGSDEALPADGTRCQAAGWGKLWEDGLQAEYLQVATLPLANREECSNQFKKVRMDLGKSVFCAGDAKGKVDACRGDSGGPLFCLTDSGRFQQYGVVSWGRGCARVGFHGIFAKVSDFRSWIESKIQQLS